MIAITQQDRLECRYEVARLLHEGRVIALREAEALGASWDHLEWLRNRERQAREDMLHLRRCVEATRVAKELAV